MERNHQNLSIGVVGGGQLAQMLAEAAKKVGVDVIVQTPAENDPAVLAAKGIVQSNTDDINGTKQLMQHSRCVIFENEWVDIEALSLLEDSGAFFLPKLSAMAPLVNKLLQRKLLHKLNIPGPYWFSLSTLKINDLKLPGDLCFPLMAKSSLGGYDGKGTKVINDYSELRELIATVDTKSWFLEQWVNYDKELSLVVSRDHAGKIRTFPLFETFQSKQVCNWVLAPAEVSHPVQAMACNIAHSLVRQLDYRGVLAIEFFFGEQGLLVNEIAPRTHNSGHLTIEACSSSQFDHQIAIAAGLGVSSAELICSGAMMVNLLGFEDPTISIENRLKLLEDIPDLFIHWYNKATNTPGRKLGHVTKLFHSDDPHIRRQDAHKTLHQIRKIWPID